MKPGIPQPPITSDGLIDGNPHNRPSESLMSYAEEVRVQHAARASGHIAGESEIVIDSEVKEEVDAIRAQQILVEKQQHFKDGLDDVDRENLGHYAQELISKSLAQDNDDGAGSIMHGQLAGQAFRQLSNPAKQVAENYANVTRALATFET